MPSIQDKHILPNDQVFTSFLRSQYLAALNDGWWWLEPMPPLLPGNISKRVEYARRMSGIHGVGDPVWGASIIHMAEQASGTPFSVEGPESAVKNGMDLLFSAPGGYREMIKQLCLNWVIADIGAPLEIIWSNPRKIREGVYYKTKPVGLDVFDPARLRLVAPQNADYPYAYRSSYPQRREKPSGWGNVFQDNEIPLHKLSVGRIVNLPQTDETLFGCGVSPTAIAVQEWQIAMGYLGLLLQDSTNTSAYNILVGRNLTERQVVEAMQNRQIRLEENHTHALASALMLFANEDALADGDSGPSIQGVPLRRYAENWDWRMWLEERIQIYATILGISPMSIIMSIYARANQAGAQYAADEAGVRRTSLMVGLSDLFADLVGQCGATFQFRSHRLADRDREYVVKKTAAEAWRIMYEANINGIPLLADTPQEAAMRARSMMAEERLIRDEYAQGEDFVEWDTEPSGTLQGAKQMAFLAGALRGERYLQVEVDPSGQSTRVQTTVVGRCVLREPGRPAQWRGWSSKDLKRMAPMKAAAASLKTSVHAAALKASRHAGAMIALYPTVEDAQALALQGQGSIPADELHVTLAYIKDRAEQQVTVGQVRKVVELFAAKTAAQAVTVSGIGRFGKVNDRGTQAVYASIDGKKLHDLNEHLVDVLEGIGVVSESEHGFQPHMTLAYVPEDAESPVDTVSERMVVLDRVALVWGNQTYTFPLLPVVEREVGALPAGAPRKQRQLQEAWEQDLTGALRKLRRTLAALSSQGPADSRPITQDELEMAARRGSNAAPKPSDPAPLPPFGDREEEQLQEYLDRWDMSLDALEARGFNLEKLGVARVNLENLQTELDRKRGERNTRPLLAALAIFVFSDTVQRRGTAHIKDGMSMAGMGNEHHVLLFELQDLGAHVQGSLLPDLINEYTVRGSLSSRLDRRTMVFYGGALWTAMQLAVMTMAQPGTLLRVEGPRDGGNCQESDPGEGIACASIVGLTYEVGRDVLPVLGRDTKCRQACRHWWEPA